MPKEQKENLTPALPLSEDRELEYRHIDNYGDLIKQNFKNLLLTIPGERMMDVDFGVGVQRYLFENGPAASSEIRGEVIRKVDRYMPFVDVRDVVTELGEEEQSIIVRVFYAVPSLAIDEYINLSFAADGSIIS